MLNSRISNTDLPIGTTRLWGLVSIAIAQILLEILSHALPVELICLSWNQLLTVRSLQQLRQEHIRRLLKRALMYRDGES